MNPQLLLKSLTQIFPYTTMTGDFRGAHHLTLEPKTDRLVVNIWSENRLFPVRLDEADLQQPEETIVAEVERVVAEHKALLRGPGGDLTNSKSSA